MEEAQQSGVKPEGELAPDIKKELEEELSPDIKSEPAHIKGR